MNYIKQFYSGFKELTYPREPIKSNYVAKNNFLFKNTIFKPVFKDEFNVFSNIKYQKLFQTTPNIYTSINPIDTCVELEKDELYYEKLPINYQNLDSDDENINDENINDENINNENFNLEKNMDSKLVIVFVFLNFAILYGVLKNIK
jgi:hypothetical protein